MWRTAPGPHCLREHLAVEVDGQVARPIWRPDYDARALRPAAPTRRIRHRTWRNCGYINRTFYGPLVLPYAIFFVTANKNPDYFSDKQCKPVLYRDDLRQKILDISNVSLSYGRLTPRDSRVRAVCRGRACPRIWHRLRAPSEPPTHAPLNQRRLPMPHADCHYGHPLATTITTTRPHQP